MAKQHETISQQAELSLNGSEELKGFISRVRSGLGDTSGVFSNYLDGARGPEVNLKMDQYSLQSIPFLKQSDEEIKALLELSFFMDACEIIERTTRECKYDPDRIRLSELRPDSLHEGGHLPGFGSGAPEVLRKHQMFRGTPFKAFVDEALQSSSRYGSFQIVAFFRNIRTRNISLGEVAWCKAAKSINLCREISAILKGDLGDWLSNIAVHTACSLKMDSYPALFGLSREIGFLLQMLMIIPIEVRSMIFESQSILLWTLSVEKPADSILF